MWQNEIMLMYPDPCQDYPKKWIEDLVRFQDKSTALRLERKDVFPFIENPDLRSFYLKLEELTQLPKSPSYPPMPEDHWTWLNTIPKKQHEIRKLAPHIHALYEKHQPEALLDIGGGVGLLAQSLNNHYGHKVISVDMNTEFQKIGEVRQKKNSRHPGNPVTYLNFKVSEDSPFSKLFEHKLLPVGLHTCGKLALDMIKISASKKVPALINFGCCYHTLDENSDLQNLSAFARHNDPLFLNKFALTLACRAHKKMSEKDYDFKILVKRYRYAIHILLHDSYGIPDMLGLGNSQAKLYASPFSDYAREQFKRIDLPLRHSDEELNQFFNDPNLQLLIKEMLAGGLIRNALGRALELYLLLDRAIYLDEQGYEVMVSEFFDEEISPRNIGLSAQLKSPFIY